ncbi:hydroxyethylthiazole kinase [Desulfovibrio inopinatus]|uniref:hydroxyethylthiazole kinase n=1 Tax=Desulfovibrio inopinatus TaxID=102109 RepID=UPI0004821FAC|nr:hydroxyethylthiazole kinase [Desulfovibrio inopinatus]
MSHYELIWKDVVSIRERCPLVLSVTNNVVTNLTANALLAIGASPAMSHAAEDAAELAGLAQAVVLNMGTPESSYVESMNAAGMAANTAHVPIVFDPVAVGATNYRSATARHLMEKVTMTVIRGNASEIMSLAGQTAASRGVDSLYDGGEAAEAGRSLSSVLDCVVCVSGAEDIVVGKNVLRRIFGGHELMPRVTGMGCTATAIVGAFLAVNPDPFAATFHAMAVMSVAGMMAGQNVAGPASFQVRFLDSLYVLTKKDIETYLHIA